MIQHPRHQALKHKDYRRHFHSEPENARGPENFIEICWEIETVVPFVSRAELKTADFSRSLQTFPLAEKRLLFSGPGLERIMS